MQIVSRDQLATLTRAIFDYEAACAKELTRLEREKESLTAMKKEFRRAMNLKLDLYKELDIETLDQLEEIA